MVSGIKVMTSSVESHLAIACKPELGIAVAETSFGSVGARI